MNLSSVTNNTIDMNEYNIIINGGCSLMIKDLRKKKAELENQVIQLKNEIKEQDEDLEELNNELKSKNEKIEEYKTLINDEKGKNYRLQKKLKELNNKLSTLDGFISEKDQYTNNNINYNNINNYLNIYSNRNDNNDIISKTIFPDNYNIIKCVHLSFNNRQLKWYLFHKINKVKRKNSIPLSFKNYKLSKPNDINEDDIIIDDYNDISYTDFLFIPERNKNDFNKFNLPLSESYEKEKVINELESALKNMEKKYKKKEKDFNILNINFSKLLYKNKNSGQNLDKLLNTIERLKTENNYLNKRLMKYSNENNFIGVSFIENNENESHYLDDKCFEDILDELDNRSIKNNDNHILNNLNFRSQRNSYKNINIPYVNKNQVGGNEKYFYSSATKFYPSSFKTISNPSEINVNGINGITDNYILKNIKDSFITLLGQINPSQNAKITIDSILKQLGCNDNEKLRTIPNYRGVISMPSSNNRYKK